MCWQFIKRQLLHVGSEGLCDDRMVQNKEYKRM